MTIEELAEERVNLQMTLQAIMMTNIYGMSGEDRVRLELQQIGARKRLNQVNAQILEYENDLN